MTETSIHPTAVIEKGARLGEGVSVGPFCYLSSEAVIGDRTRLLSHVTVSGATTIGADCTVHPQAVLGDLPQNTKHKGGRTTLTIGNNCTIREGVTMHRGTDTSRGATTVGDNGNFLAFTHIAHDCVVGNNVTMANLATLGGHVEIGDFVTIGGLSGVHQMSRIGHHAFVGGMSGIFADLIPYGMALGNRSKLRGLNIIGMRRSGIPKPEIHNMRRAYRLIFDRAAPLEQNLAKARIEFAGSAIVADVIAFISTRTKRHFVVPPLGRGADDDDGDD